MGKRGNETNKLKDKKVGEYAQGLASERWHRLYVSRKEGGRGNASIKDYVNNQFKYLRKKLKRTKKDYYSNQ